ncbi:RNA splicing factor [Tirmania nivea]|nr:RNA splicing factor [Tirmania nivea]
MSSLDVEALLEEPFKAATPSKHHDRPSSSGAADGDVRNGKDGRDRSDRHRDDRDRGLDRDDGRSTPRSHDSRRRSRDSERRRRRDYDDDGYDERRGRYSADRDRDRDDRYYRRRDYDDRDDRDYDRRRRRTRSPRRRGGRSRSRTRSPQLTEDERDRRTVFVQQLAARLRTKELVAFFEKAGPVKEAQIVKDRVSGRSKGVGYVEFKDEASVPKAIQLTGQRLLGIPIIAQLTEAEKNRQARVDQAAQKDANTVPFHRLYVGNIHFSITENDLRHVFEPWGELEFVQLQKEEGGRSRGYGFVQYRDPAQAREALEKMNGFDLAGRPIRVGLGNDKFTPESTAQMLQRFGGQQSHGQGGYEGRRIGGGGGRNDDKNVGAGASALDDTDVAGVNFNNYSRDLLMRKLARQDEPASPTGKPGDKAQKQPQRAPEKLPPKLLPVNVSMASRCIVLKNMFDSAEESGEAWVKELEDEVKAECEAKYGKIVHISLDPNSQGEIYIKFEKVSGGEKAIQGLNGRFFGGRRISASPVVDAVYSSMFRLKASAGL